METLSASAILQIKSECINLFKEREIPAEEVWLYAGLRLVELAGYKIIKEGK